VKIEMLRDGPARPVDEATPAPDRVALLRLMLTIRACDRREGSLVRQGRGHIHIPGEGHEALAALGPHLKADDYVFGYYRDRALHMARGVTPLEMARDHLATAASSSGGRMMPVHGSYRRLGIFPPVTPTAAQLLPAVGAAWGAKRAGAGQVVITTVGDASTRQGEFYEALCLAIEHTLPVVFIVEDNGFGISTRTRHQLPFRLGVFDPAIYRFLDGRDADTVATVGGAAIAACRAGVGPQVLWCELDRLVSHTNSDDHRIYRSAEEIERMRERDPVEILTRRLIAEGLITESEREDLAADVELDVGDAFAEAEAEAGPDPATAAGDLWASPPKEMPPPLEPGEWTMAAALNKTLGEALARIPETLLFGEDIEDPKGGVFGFTRGLSSAHPGRVVNAPLAEATIVGAGVGIAAVGARPVFEIQFVDFLAPAFNQLLNQAATLSWRSQGEWRCPLVIYAPYGAYLPAGGPWHSQSGDGFWTHIPGLNVAVPSRPDDLAGLLWTAMHGEDPLLLLVPKHMMRVRHKIEVFDAVPLGEARILRSGDDVTLVTWGNCVEIAEAAAERFDGSVEIIDLRSLVPCDWPTIEHSLARTGRLVVVTEDSITSSFGQSIISGVVTVPERFEMLLSPPMLVARTDSHIPYHPDLEAAVLPDVARVLAALATVMQ